MGVSREPVRACFSQSIIILGMGCHRVTNVPGCREAFHFLRQRNHGKRQGTGIQVRSEDVGKDCQVVLVVS